MLYIYGYGGFAREVASFLPRKGYSVNFVVDDEYYGEEMEDWDVVPYPDFVNHFVKGADRITVAIGDPKIRKSIVDKLLMEGSTTFGLWGNTFLRKSVQPRDQISNAYGVGNIFCPGSIITTNVMIENHNHFNLNTTIGHDCGIGSYNTFSPGVNISGNVTIGDSCYFGTNSAVKEGVSICSGVTIGMGAVVLNNITEPGTYVGVPCKKIQ